jgi:hypothetical protein
MTPEEEFKRTTSAMHDQNIITIPMPLLPGEDPAELMAESIRRLVLYIGKQPKRPLTPTNDQKVYWEHIDPHGGRVLSNSRTHIQRDSQDQITMCGASIPEPLLNYKVYHTERPVTCERCIKLFEQHAK